MKKLALFIALFTAIVTVQAQKKPLVKTIKKTVKKPIATPTTKAPAEVFTKVKITTDSGVIIVKLYNKTPLHRDNFIKLVTEKKYDSLLFHRVIAGFMIQGGDPDSKFAQPGVQLGGGSLGYTIPAEFDSTLIHKKGALAAARTNNPLKESSASQFYLVQGTKITDAQLNMLELQKGFKYTKAQRTLYKTIGGTPFLDRDYTVYGEVISGLKVIDKIANTQKAYGDRPVNDIRMRMEIIK
jgi:cyclophilin family peptidyl-prolyl cis-trans isomerase